MLGRDVFESVLLGVAIGDALGLPLEFEWSPPRGSWLESFEGLRCVSRGGACAYSDDTEMTLILARSIAVNCGLDQDRFAEDLAGGAAIEDEIRYYGAGTIAVIKMLRRGIPWRRASAEVYEGGNYGNGGAIRVAPVPLYYHDDGPGAVAREAERQCAVTHSHPLGVEAARLQALGVYYSLEGVNPRELPSVLRGHASSDTFKSRLDKVVELIKKDPGPREVVEALGNGTPGYESVPAALYAHARGEGNPPRAVLAALSLGGDADSIASMAAALSAAYTRGLGGLESIAPLIEGSSGIREVAGILHKAYRECH